MNVELYWVVKTIHIVSSTIVFGTGIGIAFFMFRSLFSSNVHEKYYAARTTVLADAVFTLPAVIVQPLSGFALIYLVGRSWTDWWLVVTYVIYVLAGALWLMAVWIQLQLKNMTKQAVEQGDELPARYRRLFKVWVALGCPAFLGLVVVFYLLVAKPV